MLTPNDAHQKFAERFLHDQHRLYGYIVTLVPSRTDAEEIFQETSLLLWEKWSEFDQSRDLFPWACGIAHNVVRNYLRKKRPHVAIMDEPFLDRIAQSRLEMESDLAPRRQALAACLDELPVKQRTLLEECYSGTVRMNQLANRLGLTANALYLRLGRLRTILLECINRRFAKEGPL